MKAKTLKNAVGEAIKFAGTGDAMPVTTHILIVSDITGGMKVAATDFEARIEISIPEALGDWSACVPAKPLLEFLSSAGNDDLTARYEQRTGTLNFTAGNANAKFKCIDAAEFPSAPTNEWTANFSFDKLSAAEWPSRVGFCTSDDKARPILQGYHLKLVNLTLLYVEAADGFRLGRIRTTSEPIKGTKSVLDGSWNILKKPFENALRLGVDQFSAGHAVCLLQNSTIKVWIQLVEGMYPDLTQVIPKPAANEATVEQKTFLTAIRRSQLMSELTCFATEESGIAVRSGETEIGQHSEVMPAEKANGKLEFCLASQFAFEAANAGIGKYTISCAAPTAPVLITEVGNGDWTHVIMPRHTKES